MHAHTITASTAIYIVQHAPHALSAAQSLQKCWNPSKQEHYGAFVDDTCAMRALLPLMVTQARTSTMLLVAALHITPNTPCFTSIHVTPSLRAQALKRPSSGS